jgi:Cuticle protein
MKVSYLDLKNDQLGSKITLGHFQCFAIVVMVALATAVNAGSVALTALPYAAAPLAVPSISQFSHIDYKAVPAAVPVATTYAAAPIAAPLAYQASPLAYQASPLAYHASPLAYHASPLAYHAAPLAYHAAPLAYSAPIAYSAPAVYAAPAVALEKQPATYTAQTRGAIHTAPLEGHDLSQTSINVEAAPGTE